MPVSLSFWPSQSSKDHKTKKMKIVTVTYTAKPGYVEKNTSNIKNVMADLQNGHHPGILYHVCLHPDGKTFVHTAFFNSEEDHQLLNGLESFKRFQKELIPDGIEVAPKQALLSLVGSSTPLFNV
jgi:hypothetical protein